MSEIEHSKKRSSQSEIHILLGICWDPLTLELGGNMLSGESHPEGGVMPQNPLDVAQGDAGETMDRGVPPQSLCCRAIPGGSCWPMGVSEHHALQKHSTRAIIW